MPFAFLKVVANGTAIPGTSVIERREGWIEVRAFSHSVAREFDGTVPRGRAELAHFTIVKRNDRSTPLLMRALTDNQAITAELEIEGPNLEGDGTTVTFTKYEMTEAYIVSIETNYPYVAEGFQPVLETVKIAMGGFTITYVPEGISHQLRWHEG